MLRRSVALALIAFVGLGCEPAIPPLLPPDDPGPTGEVTYYEHVRPILVESCTMCHQAGGIAPFSLETYEATVTVADRMVEATALRIMPPFLADNSGECQTFSNHRGLTDEEIATIDAWVDGGVQEGDPASPAPTPGVLPSLPDGEQVVLEMPELYAIDEARSDDYRCFVVDPGLTADRFVTGYDVHPGNTQRVHHVIVYNPTSDAAAQQAADLDAGDGVVGDGYPCFGGASVSATPVVLWAPGTGATQFPRGTGLELAAGRPQVIQIHYNNLVEDSANTDLTTITLALSASETPAVMALINNGNIDLPPRMREVSTSRDQSFAILPFPVHVYGVFPHMHTLGRTLRMEVDPDGGGATECLIDVPRWDFNWQLAYWLDRPMRVTPEGNARITCTYDTMSRADQVGFGEGTEDEMCLAFVYVSL